MTLNDYTEALAAAGFTEGQILGECMENLNLLEMVGVENDEVFEYSETQQDAGVEEVVVGSPEAKRILAELHYGVTLKGGNYADYIRRPENFAAIRAQVVA